MREHTRLRLISESRRIYNRLVWFAAALVASIILLTRPETLDSLLWFGVGVTGALVSLVAIALNILLVHGLDYGDEPMPPANDVSDTLLFSEQRQPNMQMESRDGNTIRLGRFKPDKGQWWQLSESLERHGWSWTRDNVEEADIFVSLSGKYAALTEEMLRLDFVDGGRIKTITPRGQQWFIEQSPRLFDEHIR